MSETEVVVVGGGLAGSIAALTLAEAGLDVLVLEAGQAVPGAAPRQPTRVRRAAIKLGLAPPLQAQDYWPDPLEFHPTPDGRNGRLIPAMLGTGPGGSSIVFGAAMERLRRADFEHDDGARIPGSLPNAWPVSYDSLRGYYARAETLMRLVGTPDPLDPDDDGRLAAPPALSPGDVALWRDLSANGLHPYRVHLGFDYRPGCAECIDRRCPFGCKADGFSRALRPALSTGRVRLVQGAAVSAVARKDGGLEVQAVLADGTVQDFRARRVVLAAGALNSPLVLDRSPGLWRGEAPPPMIGRGLMFHVSDVFAVFQPGRPKGAGPARSLAFRDFYEVDGAPFGLVQSMGRVPDTGRIHAYLKLRAAKMGLGDLGLLLEFLRPLACAGAKLLHGCPLFASVMEDHPYPGNRVWSLGAPSPATPAGRIAFAYQPAPELRARARQMRQMLHRAFAPNRLLFLTDLAMPNLGHPVGTCRMGTDPAFSVTDAEGRVWGTQDVFVADASLFPSSGGANPSLTVAANAMRVAEVVAADLCGRPASSRSVS